MTDKSKPPKKHDSNSGLLDTAIDVLNTFKSATSMTPAPAVFAIAIGVLTAIRDKMANDQGCVNLGILCKDVCVAFSRETCGKEIDDLSELVRDAMERLEKSIQEIKQEVDKLASKNEFVKFFTASDGKGKIAGWKKELEWILHFFNAEVTLDTNAKASKICTTVTDIQTTTATIHTEVIDVKQAMIGLSEMFGDWMTESSVSQGELPPPPPNIFFGRNELVKEIVSGIVSSTEKFKSIALIGTGGIGKTSIILTVLDHHEIKEQFNENRFFIPCDQLPPTPSRAHLLRKLSEVIGAGVETPEDLSSLRPYLISKKMIIVLDNAESILGPNTREIYGIVNELNRYNNIFLAITSRNSNAIPSPCETIEIPILSMKAGHDTFYEIHKLGEQSDEINNILKELDFHPLSITLLANAAKGNKWTTKKLVTRWVQQRTGVLQTPTMGSLGEAIELSLESPAFQGLGSDARDVLGVVAFFPQGVNEDDDDGVFSIIPDGPRMLDTFCSLSLTQRGDRFTTMLAPLRDYLCLKDPVTSPLLRAAKEHYFQRLSCQFTSAESTIKGLQWIVSEGVNVEHLLRVFKSSGEDVLTAHVDFVKMACAVGE